MDDIKIIRIVLIALLLLVIIGIFSWYYSIMVEKTKSMGYELYTLSITHVKLALL